MHKDDAFIRKFPKLPTQQGKGKSGTNQNGMTTKEEESNRRKTLAFIGNAAHSIMEKSEENASDNDIRWFACSFINQIWTSAAVRGFHISGCISTSKMSETDIRKVTIRLIMMGHVLRYHYLKDNREDSMKEYIELTGHRIVSAFMDRNQNDLNKTWNGGLGWELRKENSSAERVTTKGHAYKPPTDNTK